MSIFKAQEGQQREVQSVLAPMIGRLTAALPNLLLDRGSPNRNGMTTTPGDILQNWLGSGVFQVLFTSVSKSGQGRSPGTSEACRVVLGNTSCKGHRSLRRWRLAPPCIIRYLCFSNALNQARIILFRSFTDERLMSRFSSHLPGNSTQVVDFTLLDLTTAQKL